MAHCFNTLGLPLLSASLNTVPLPTSDSKQQKELDQIIIVKLASWENTFLMKLSNNAESDVTIVSQSNYSCLQLQSAD